VGSKKFLEVSGETLERVAKARQQQSGGYKRKGVGSEKFSEPPALAQVAQSVGMSRPTMIKAREVVVSGDEELIAEMDSTGKVEKAYRTLRRRQNIERLGKTVDWPADKYRVLYADPPWRYRDSGIVGADAYGHAERHYPTMSITELCELPILDIAADNAVLFLWATSPFLEDSFRVIKAWGFDYKTSFVWDKVGHNYGHYNSVRHEFLLVCTRGSCVPDNPKLYDSVQTIEKSREHSRKPEQFREIIDTLYPRGKRVELFARERAAGWDVWGNEPDILWHTE